MPSFLSIGEVLWDLLPQGAKPGGAPVNFAYHAQVLGAQAAFVSAVGTDKLGDDLLDFFRSIGLSIELVQRINDAPTGTVGVQLGSDGQPKYTIHENTAWDKIECTSAALDYVKNADVVCYGSLSSRNEITRETVQTLLKNCGEKTLRVLDLNLRAPFIDKEIIETLLKTANVLKLNDEEIAVISEMFGCPQTDIFSRAEWLVEMYGFRFVILTRSDRGSVLLKNSETIEIANHPGFALSHTEIADTVGAGDGFTAAAIRGFLLGWSLDKINEVANGYAAYICTQAGAAPQIPERFTKLFA